MRIEFYEEFPNKENLRKLKLIKFPTKIFIAAKTLEEFQKFEKIAKSYKKNLEVAYWPIIKNSYWISPFSNPGDLKELFDELNKIKNPLLIDLELPLKKRKLMYIKNSLKFFKNKKLIKSFLEQNKLRITTAEYHNLWVVKLMRLLGLNYRVKTEKSIMWYSSMRTKKVNQKVIRGLLKIKNKSNYSVSIGTTAIGMMGNEPKISPENLEKDLQFVKKAGFKKVVIFRLEGLNKEYIKILNKFSKK